MIVAETITETRRILRQARQGGKTVGLVPTMGALHAGHTSLIDAARNECGVVVVSIFVNPTQFGPGEDFEKYPRTPEADLALCEQHGAAVVFAPGAEEMYGPENVSRASGPRVPRASRPRDDCMIRGQDGRDTRGQDARDTTILTTVSVAKLSETLCGRRRPGHFAGVCTVVTKLFNITQPDRAYFGEKDYQQAAILRRMAADLNMPVQIVACPIVREADGLAMSSRNVYLSAGERKQAPALYAALQKARDLVRQDHPPVEDVIRAIREKITAEAPLGEIDYVQLVDPDTLQDVTSTAQPVQAALAVRFGGARLIDNLRLG
ncbi:MAG: pantoate--beta-alanine ligase [Phycisphaerae bacterium]|nr:pantoate--beta-alanine ligase [Phycisphaerae bacterium]